MDNISDLEKAKILVSEKKLDAACKIYKSLTMNVSYDKKLDALIDFIKNIPDEGLDVLARWRDCIKFLKGDVLSEHIVLLNGLIRDPRFSSFERITTCVSLYNNNFIEQCYSCFSELACDPTVLLDHRLEACRYLFASDQEINIQLSQECILDIVSDVVLPSDYRYKIIAGYISRTGISTFLNARKLKIPYNEKFVYGLQTSFFYNTDNEAQYRILSGQHMLDMECVNEKEKIEIGNILLEIAKTESLTENTKADAADVVLRLGIGEQKTKAREIIVGLGFSATGKDSKNLLAHAKTIYSNSQNVHDQYLSEQVEKFIVKMVTETGITLPQYADVYLEICNLISGRKLEPKKRISALKALNRVNIDSATFTEHRVTLAELLVHVWTRINKYADADKKYLIDRLLEELVDMGGDVCSSGHSSRFVNVLACKDESLKISWASQIEANIAGRLQAQIRNLPDGPEGEAIYNGMASKDAKDPNRLVFTKFTSAALKKIEREMRQEFVGGKYVSEADFVKYFADGKQKWIV